MHNTDTCRHCGESLALAHRVDGYPCCRYAAEEDEAVDALEAQPEHADGWYADALALVTAHEAAHPDTVDEEDPAVVRAARAWLSR